MANQARRHHTVPKFYLEGFARSGKIGTVRLPGEKRFCQSTANASLRMHFYTVPDLEEPDAFEKRLSAMETEAATIMRKVISGGVWPLDLDDRVNFAIFLAVQFLRGPDKRRQMEQTVALVTQREVVAGGRESVPAWIEHNYGFTPTDEEAEQIWRDVNQPGGPPVTLSAAGHLEQIGSLVPEFLPYFTGRPWVLLRFERRALLTCDTPLSLLPDRRSPGQAVGLVNSPGIVFPMSRRVGLMLADPEPLIDRLPVEQVREGHADFELTPSSDDARDFNTATIRNTREWIFHHPDDSDLVPAKLPEPVATEVSTSTNALPPE